MFCFVLFFLVVEVVVVPHVRLLQFYCIIFIFGGLLLIAIKCQISERFSAFRFFSRLQKFSLTQKIKLIFRWLPFNSYKNCERFLYDLTGEVFNPNSDFLDFHKNNL